MSSQSGMSDPGDDVTSPRRRGRPKRISREQIVSAARGLAPEQLTMQAVADVLRVDPKSLNYHVGDREGLRKLVALDVFESELGRVNLPIEGDWRQVMGAYCMALRDAVVRLGVLAADLRLPEIGRAESLLAAERVLRVLVDAGFEVDQARRVLIFVTDLAGSAGRDAVLVAHNQLRPNVAGVTSVLDQATADEFPVLRQAVALSAADTDAADQLQFNLTVVIAGLERKLADRIAPEVQPRH